MFAQAKRQLTKTIMRDDTAALTEFFRQGVGIDTTNKGESRQALVSYQDDHMS